MAEMRSRDAMYAGLLSATAQHEHEAVTLRGEAHQLREELGAIHARAAHLQSERDSMMLKMERGHEELHRSQAARRELEERVAAMEAEQQQAAARFAALQGGLEEKNANIQQVRATPATMSTFAISSPPRLFTCAGSTCPLSRSAQPHPFSSHIPLQLQNQLDTSVKAAQEAHERLRGQGETELQAAKTRADESEARVAELERRLKEAEQTALEAQEATEKVQFELELSHALLEESAHTHDENLASAVAKADEFRATMATALHVPSRADLAELEKAAAELYQLAQTTAGHREQMRRAEEERNQASSAIREQLELVHECVTAICTESAGETAQDLRLRASSDIDDGGHSENDAPNGDGATRVDRPASKSSKVLASAAAAAAAHASGDSDASSAAVDRRRRRQQQARRRHERRHADNLPLAASLRPLKFQLSAALRRSPKEGSPLADVAHHTLDSLMQLMTWFEAALKREQARAEADFAQERASLLGAKREADERAGAAESSWQLASESVERGREAVTQLQAQLSSKADALSKAQAGESAAIVRAVSASEAAAAAEKRAEEAGAALEESRRRLADLERDFNALSQKRGRSHSHSHSRGRSRSAARNDDGALRDAAASRGARAHSASPGMSRRPLGAAADASTVPSIRISSAAASERAASEAVDANDAGGDAHSGLHDDDDESGTASEAESGCPGCAEAWARLDTSEAALGEAAAAERRASTALAAQERLVKELRDAGYVRMSRLRDLEGELRLAQASTEEKQAAAQREEERLSRELMQAHERCHAQQARLAELEETVAQSSDARALQQYRGEATELRGKVAALEARLTDVRADLNDDLKAQLLDLQEELDEARRERDEERQSRDERRQAAALQIATLKAEINVRDNTIEALRETVALLQRDDSKELIKKFEERVEELEEEKRLVEAQVEEQRGLVAVANERISFLEDMRQKDDTVSRLEARLEKSKALIDELKQASEEDALALRDLRARVLEHESELEVVRKELRTRTLQLEDARALGRYFVAQVETLIGDIVTALDIHNPPPLAGEVWQELPSKEAAAEDLQAQLLIDMSEAQRKKRWEKSLSKLQEEMLGKIRRVHGEAERLASLESKYKNDADRIVEVMKMQCDERVRLLEAKLQRKETVLAGYDKDLGQLHLLKVACGLWKRRLCASQTERGTCFG
jgi:chromosome segregation ATPase